MSALTPITSRLSTLLDDEFLRMQNEWFFRWHHIGGTPAVEIESFNGRPIRYGGIRFSGSARQVYWDTIQRYLRKKIGTVFDELESDLSKYTLDVRMRALTEVQRVVTQFALKIRRSAVEKDSVLRGDGFNIPPENDQGYWIGCQPEDIEKRVVGLRSIYCSIQTDVGGVNMPFQELMNDRLRFVKKDGSMEKSDIPAHVSSKGITTFDATLPVEVGDSFIRKLPSGLVENYIVLDPGYSAGMLGAIPPSFHVQVRRSDAPPPHVQSVVFTGANSRMNVNSTDNSHNQIVYSGQDLSTLGAELAKLRAALLPLAREPEDYAAIGAVASAEIAAKEGVSPKVAEALYALGKGGQWVLNTAKDVGVPLAVAALKSHLGLPPG